MTSYTRPNVTYVSVPARCGSGTEMLPAYPTMPMTQLVNLPETPLGMASLGDFVYITAGSRLYQYISNGTLAKNWTLPGVAVKVVGFNQSLVFQTDSLVFFFNISSGDWNQFPVSSPVVDFLEFGGSLFFSSKENVTEVGDGIILNQFSVPGPYIPTSSGGKIAVTKDFVLRLHEDGVLQWSRNGSFLRTIRFVKNISWSMPSFMVAKDNTVLAKDGYYLDNGLLQNTTTVSYNTGVVNNGTIYLGISFFSTSFIYEFQNLSLLSSSDLNMRYEGCESLLGMSVINSTTLVGMNQTHVCFWNRFGTSNMSTVDPGRAWACPAPIIPGDEQSKANSLTTLRQFLYIGLPILALSLILISGLCFYKWCYVRRRTQPRLLRPTEVMNIIRLDKSEY